MTPAPFGHLQELPSGQLLALIWDRNLVGRSSDAGQPQVDLGGFSEGGVSRRHAEITRSEGQVYVEDLNSSNGTFLNGVKLQPGLQHPLRPDDEVRFGSLRFQYKQK